MAQGTIKIYDTTTKVGSLLDDAGQEFPFDADSFRGSGVRMFRLGQRVRYELEGEGSRQRVRGLTIITM